MEAMCEWNINKQGPIKWMSTSTVNRRADAQYKFIIFICQDKIKHKTLMYFRENKHKSWLLRQGQKKEAFKELILALTSTIFPF